MLRSQGAFPIRDQHHPMLYSFAGPAHCIDLRSPILGFLTNETKFSKNFDLLEFCPRLYILNRG